MASTEVTIEILREVTEEHVVALAPLITQLSSSSPPPDLAHLRRVTANPDVTLFCARDGAGTIVGELCLVMFAIPTGLRALIEDVVVTAEARGKGVATMLTKAAIELCRKSGVATIDLTSRPSREEANRLYQNLGFARRETNVYRYDFSKSQP